jgi:peptide/nickel transport system permease protein
MEKHRLNVFRFFQTDNLRLILGLLLLLGLVAFWVIGGIFTDASDANPISGAPSAAPSMKYLLGTDAQGRQMLPLMVAGVPITLRIGLIAGGLGVLAGTVLGFTAGYFRGWVDTLIRSASDVVLTIPALAVLVVVASTLSSGGLSANSMALIVALLSWMWPTRTIRAQVLSMRERSFVDMARLSGMGNYEIIVRELLPNLLPYLVASFVAAVAAAILAAIGLEALGLGPQNDPTLGMTIYWSMFYGAVLSGWWWWYAPPIVVLVWIFVALYMTSSGLDTWANPKLRRI